MRKFYPGILLPDWRRTFTTVLIFLIFASGFAQIPTPEDKIDPVFRLALPQANARQSQTPKHFSPAFKVTPTNVLTAAGRPAEERYDCIIYTSDVTALRNNGVIVNSVLPKFVTAWVTPEQIQQISQLASVRYIAAPVMEQLHNDIAVASSGASLLHTGKLNNTVYKGKGVIVAIFDSGIDWKHLDFRGPDDTTQSRILRIWDQTITPIAGEVSPTGFNYGVEYTQAQISDELDGSPTGFVRERDFNGHGTHVAGTAAGNGAAIPATRKYTGMAPEADIVVIKGGDGSFSSTNIINSITYLTNLANTLGKPVVLNMSLGGQFGPHDGTGNHEVAVNNFTASAPGRVVVISAGNDNGANIHNQLSLAANATNSVTFNVPAGTTGENVFEYRIYVNDNSNVTATLTEPSGAVSATAVAGQNNSGVFAGGGFNGYIFNQTDVGNGDRYIDVYVERNGTGTASPAGTWTLSLTNNTTNALTLHGWLYYINAAFASTSVATGNSDYLVGSPGNATSAITVASFVGKYAWYSYASSGAWSVGARMDAISSFSSHGPRRDGVLKPEITAVGQQMISALSSTTSSVDPREIVIPGKYRQNQGTSMSAPVVTGAVALLLQGNPTATIAQVRTALFSNTSTDPFTEAPGATPNATWGYGRLDVFRAAAANAAAGCSPVSRKTYQYDASNTSSQDGGVTYSTQRASVRFTPDISGKMAGAYFHTSTAKTALVMELRTNNAGVPGTLLGTVNLPDTSVALYNWNYVDLSSLNISVTSGTDYFVVVYRDAASAANWSMRAEATSVDNRSLNSANGGVSWGNPGLDYKIRPVVYGNAQLTAGLATANTASNKDIATSNLFIDNSCQVIAQLTPSGTSPVSGSVTANVWIESGVPNIGGNPFVARHYQVTPATNATTATGRVTLYFTQAEFSAFNADANSTVDLPSGPTDNAGKANLRIVKYGGSSSDGTGLPATYSGSVISIDPADNDIVWNAEANRWEVSFTVTGFSGFIVQTIFTPLPLLVESFSGYPKGSANILNWKVSCMNSIPVFDIERSAGGNDFSPIGTTTVPPGLGCNQTFVFEDNHPLTGKNYYRIKITEDGATHYTRFILLQTGKTLVTTLYPNVISAGQSIQVVNAENEGVLRINDARGRQIYSHNLTMGIQSIILPATASGIYFYSIQNSQGTQATGKLIIQ